MNDATPVDSRAKRDLTEAAGSFQKADGQPDAASPTQFPNSSDNTSTENSSSDSRIWPIVFAMCGGVGVCALVLGITLGWFGSLGSTNGLLSDIGVTEIQVKARLGAAITANGDAYTWGEDSWGNVGQGGLSSATPKALDISDVVDIALFPTAGAAVTGEGELYTWGEAGTGESRGGQVDLDAEEGVPTLVDGLTDVTSVSIGSGVVAAITADGSLYTWGANECGQLAQGTTSETPIMEPHKVTGLSNVIAVSMGDWYSSSGMAVDASGELYIWGDNEYGELGLGMRSEEPITEPRKVGLNDVIAISSAASNYAAVTADGDLYTWGSNGFGSCGHGEGDRITVPTKVEGLSDVIDVSLAFDCGAAVSAGGDVYTWGINDYGQLGNGEVSEEGIVFTPQRVEGISSARQVSMGSCSCAVLTANGEVYTWGIGMLGDGTENGSPTPIRI